MFRTHTKYDIVANRLAQITDLQLNHMHHARAPTPAVLPDISLGIAAPEVFLLLQLSHVSNDLGVRHKQTLGGPHGLLAVGAGLQQFVSPVTDGVLTLDAILDTGYVGYDWIHVSRRLEW